MIDKSDWGDGPWQSEPDRAEWRDPQTRLPCLAIRNEFGGNWCGYVAVPPEHPAHGIDYDNVDVDVHGGLTYANHCSGQICHVPEPGEPDDVWWLGFDCAHSQDIRPGGLAWEAKHGLPGLSFGGYERYRDLHYVKRECARLAAQLKAQAA